MEKSTRDLLHHGDYIESPLLRIVNRRETILNLADIKRLQTEIIRTELNNKLPESPLVTCQGYLGNIPSSTYTKYFEVPLTENEEAILIDIPKRLLHQNNIKQGDYVIVTGTLVSKIFRGVVTFRLDVTSISLAPNSQDIFSKNENEIQINNLFALRNTRNIFPKKKKIKLTLIYPKSSKASIQDDFLKPLSSLEKYIFIENRPINMTDSYEITESIKNSFSDIVVIIRGGGDAEHLTIFNNEKILHALSAQKAFRIIGIGHTANYSLTDLIADHSAATPTAAGYYIKEQYNILTKEWMHIERLTKKIFYLKVFSIFMLGIALWSLMGPLINHYIKESTPTFKAAVTSYSPVVSAKKLSRKKLKTPSHDDPLFEPEI